MNEILIKRWAFAVVRHFLNVGAGALIANGYLAPQTNTTELIAGLATAIVGVAWSLYEKRWKPRAAEQPMIGV